MKQARYFVVTFALMLLIVSCYPTYQKSEWYDYADSLSILSDSIVVLERGACYGRCPVYRLTLLNDGRGFFEGRRHTTVSGLLQFHFPQMDFRSVVSRIEASRFFQMGDRYEYDCEILATDCASSTITVHLANRHKSVYHYLGCINGSHPRELILIPAYIDSVVRTERFTGAAPYDTTEISAFDILQNR